MNEVDRIKAENKRLRLALNVFEEMTTAQKIRSDDEWREDIGAVLWAVQDVRTHDPDR